MTLQQNSFNSKQHARRKRRRTKPVLSFGVTRKHEKCQRHRISSKVLKSEEQELDEASEIRSADSQTRLAADNARNRPPARPCERHAACKQTRELRKYNARCLVPRHHSSRRHENAPALAARRAFPRADRGSNDAGVSRCPVPPPLPSPLSLPPLPARRSATFVRRMLADSARGITERFRLSKIANGNAPRTLFHSVENSSYRREIV